MNLSPPSPQDDDPIITQFRPLNGQWELNGDNITRIDHETGCTILHNYCKHINTTPLEVYRYLIETKDCDVITKDKYNDTPLHYAFEYFNPNNGGNITVLRYLLNQKTLDVNLKGQYGSTLLHAACCNINTLPLEIFQLLIETLGFDVNVQNNTDSSTLHRALAWFDPNKGGDIKVLMYLLNQNGVNGNLEACFGETLLHIACQKINKLPLEIFTVLIGTLGCNVNAREKYRDTPIHYAIQNFKPRTDGDINVLTYLLNQMGINGNLKGHNGYTLLHTACCNINSLPLDVFKLLIETIGCDINAQSDNQNTPIQFLFGCFDPNKGGDIKVLMYLLNQNGINVNIKNQYGNTILHMACEKINTLPIDVFKALVETIGCDINAQGEDNNTPLHNALRSFGSGDDIAVLYYLLAQKNINVNAKDKYGRTLLHWACKRINGLPLEIFQYLIETMGCDVNIQDNNKDIPIYYAFQLLDPNKGGDIKVLTYLLRQNNFRTKHHNGQTFLHLACINNHRTSRDHIKLNAECDTILCQIVEVIVETCIERVVDETIP
jgi:ankyrin repeat protein